MSFLNFYIGRMAYSDNSPLQNPRQKNFDFVTSQETLEVTSPTSLIKEVPPGQTIILDSTTRSIASGLSASEFKLEFLENSDIGRLRWTGVGTSPAFRTLRSINYGTPPATTEYTAIRLSPNAVEIQLNNGADLSSVSVGDEMYLQASNGSQFESPVNPLSTGQRYKILSTTTSSVTVRDAGNIAEETITLGSEYETVIRFFSSSGVQVGDKFRIVNNSNFNLENKSTDLEVREVSDRDIHFYNPNLIPEVVTAGVSTPFVVFDRLINFLAVEADGPLRLLFDNGTDELRLKEFTPGLAVFASTVSVVSVAASNPTNYSITVKVQSCTFDGGS